MLFQFSIFWNLPLTATAAWLWRKATLTSSVNQLRNSRQTAKSLESEWTTMKCVMFIHFPLDVLNAGKSGVQVQLENEIDLMSSLRHPGTLRLLYDIKHNVDAFGWNWCNVVETIQSSILLAASNVAYNLGVPKISDFWFGSCLWFGGDNVPGANGLAEKRIKNLQATSDKIQLSSLSGWLNHELSDWRMPAIGSFASQKLTLAHNIDVCSAMNLVVLFWFIIS